MAEVPVQLEAEYCPPIDPALLSAILSDYDLSNEDDVRSARITLDSLKEHALLEEAAGFDASGTGGLEEGTDSGNRLESHEETSTSRSKGTDVTSVFNQLSSVDLEDSSEGRDAPILEAEDLERLDEDTKIQLLVELFGKHVSRYTIRYILGKRSGNWHAAMEELLNHAYLAEAASGEDGASFSAKGIEGFAEDNVITRGRKGTAKVKHFKNLDQRRWQSTTESNTPMDSRGGIQIVPVYARPNIDAESNWNTASTKARSAVTSRSPSSDALSVAARSDTFDMARATAISQANAARRKAKSDHLMSGVVAYYDEIGREYAALSANASAQAADRLVALQSTGTQLDLHGVDVRNAVRIAQEKVEEWWNGLGESRVNGRIGAEDRQTGFRIVVGVGRHSVGGNSKLGPAVTKMLKQEGWIVEPSGGVLIVKRPAKK